MMPTATAPVTTATATLMGTLLGYVGLYGFLLVSYIAALRYLATKPARSASLLPQQKMQQQAAPAGDE